MSKPGREPRAKDVLEKIRSRGLRLVDIWFTEIGGRPWRLSMSAQTLDEQVFASGVTVDGRQVGGTWEGLLSIMPDPGAAFVDPTASTPTLALICDMIHASREEYVEDPRSVLKRAQAHFNEVHPELTWLIGAEVEFFVVDHRGAAAPNDTVRELLRELWTALDAAEIPTDWFRIGPADGQGRVQMSPAPALRTADQVVLYKNLAKSLARRRGLTARFMPKPLAGEGSAGMLVHHALWKQSRNLFHDPRGWAFTSPLCRAYAAGLLQHAPALLAFCAPTMNSYRRLLPDGKSPTVLTLSTSRDTAACRVPAGTTGPAEAARRIKFCCGDPSANPYLAFAAMLMAGLDGVERRLEPAIEQPGPGGSPLPATLENALTELRADCGFLAAGGVFPTDFIERWIENRWAEQIRPIRATPHPLELELDAN